MIPDLTEDLAARFVDGISECTKCWHRFLRIGTRLEMPPSLMRRATENHETATAIPNALGAIGHQIVGGRAADGEWQSMGREVVTVRKFNWSDAGWAEDMGVTERIPW